MESLLAQIEELISEEGLDESQFSKEEGLFDRVVTPEGSINFLVKKDNLQKFLYVLQRIILDINHQVDVRFIAEMTNS